jgi:hypothetical protein
MASYSKRTVTTTRVEYVLTCPTNWVEVQKAMIAAEVELGEERARMDDAVTVECRDDGLVLWYEVPQP